MGSHDNLEGVVIPQLKLKYITPLSRPLCGKARDRDLPILPIGPYGAPICRMSHRFVDPLSTFTHRVDIYQFSQTSKLGGNLTIVVPSTNVPG